MYNGEAFGVVGADGIYFRAYSVIAGLEVIVIEASVLLHGPFVSAPVYVV